MGRVCVATAGSGETGRKFEFKLRAVFFSLKKKLYMLMGRVCEETGRKFEFKLRAIFYLFIYRLYVIVVEVGGVHRRGGGRDAHARAHVARAAVRGATARPINKCISCADY